MTDVIRKCGHVGAGVAVSCGVGCGLGLDPQLLWLQCRPAAAALIWPPSLGTPYAVGTALYRSKKEKENMAIRTQRQRDTHTHTEVCPVKTGVMLPQGTSRSWKGNLQQILPKHLQRKHGLDLGLLASRIVKQFLLFKPLGLRYFFTAALAN